jgi:hypothetical protein
MPEKEKHPRIQYLAKMSFKNEGEGWVLVAYNCNPSYSGGAEIRKISSQHWKKKTGIKTNSEAYLKHYTP